MPKIIYEFESVEEVDRWVAELIREREKKLPVTRWLDVPSSLQDVMNIPCTFS